MSASTLQIDWSVNRGGGLSCAPPPFSSTRGTTRTATSRPPIASTRDAAADGATLVVLPEKFNVLGTHEDYRAGAETLEGPTVAWARELARELGIDFVAGSIVERREDRQKLSNTSVHVGPDGDVKAVYRKIHMFDVEVGGQVYRESESQEGGPRSCARRAPTASRSG